MAAWDRLDAETEPAFAAFHMYLLCPRPRSIDAAWQRATIAQQSRNGKRANGRWTNWSRDHDWVERASAYDQHLAKQDELLWEERRRQLQQRDWEQADALRRVVDDAIPHANQFIRRKTAYVKGSNGAPDREIITVEFDITALATVLEKASKIQRLATGDSTENVNLSGAALASVIEAEFRRLAHVEHNGAAAVAGLLTADESGFDDFAADGDGEVQD